MFTSNILKPAAKIITDSSSKLTIQRPFQGFCAETGGGVILTGIPNQAIDVSTTPAIAGGIMGLAPQKGYQPSAGVWVRELSMHALSQFQLVWQLWH